MLSLICSSKGGVIVAVGASRSGKYVERWKAIVSENRKRGRKTREGVRNISCILAKDARDEGREVTEEK